MYFEHILNKQVKGNAEYLQDRISRLEPTRKWVISCREYKSKRSIEQNSRLWAMYNEIGAYIGENPDRVHDLMKWKFLRYQDVINGETVELVKSTTKLNTKEMTEYQDAIERWAAEIGFYAEI